MKLNDNAIVFIPSGKSETAALNKVTHLAIAAHQDDAEFMAFSAISYCYRKRNDSFCSVVTTDGANSPRNGKFADFSDEEMRAARVNEQKRAAEIGGYGAQIMLSHSSSQAKNPRDNEIVSEYIEILRACKPRYVYTHNIADKHETHVATALKVIAALRTLNADEQPLAVYGCEVWRDLDWLEDGDKAVLDCSAHSALSRKLCRAFESQIEGGKRYDKAVQGRRLAHATFCESHACDTRIAQNYAMDLTLLMRDKSLSPRAYAQSVINRFESSVLALIDKYDHN